MIDRGRLEALVLARLSPNTKRRPSSSDLTKSLHPFVARQISPTEWQAEINTTVGHLRDAREVEPRTLSLTDAGRARLARALGLGAPPSTHNWSEFKKRYLRVLLALASASGRADPPLARSVVATALGVASHTVTTDAELANAWLAESLSLKGDKVTFGAVKAALLAKELGVPARATVREVLRLAAPKVVGATSAKTEDILQALAYQWLTPDGKARFGSGAVPAAGSSNALIRKIRETANSPDTKHFGANKVFIGSVWQHLQGDPEVQPLGEVEFKRVLVEAHQRGELTLSRADLVAAMDPGDVAASETRHLNATYHFIQVTGNQS